MSEINEVLKTAKKYIKYEMVNKKQIKKINELINKNLKKRKPKNKILKTIENCIENGLITETTAAEINDYLISALETDTQNNMNPDDLERDVGKSCESGLCPVR